MVQNKKRSPSTLQALRTDFMWQ